MRWVGTLGALGRQVGVRAAVGEQPHSKAPLGAACAYLSAAARRRRPPACLQVVLVNPQVISLGKSLTLFEEGCLSFPNMYANVEVGLGWVGVAAVLSVGRSLAPFRTDEAPSCRPFPVSAAHLPAHATCPAARSAPPSFG